MAAPERIAFEGTTGDELVMSAYRDGGDEQTPVLLLHGLSQQRAFWGPVIRRMSARPVAALDQRGHGESDTSVDADFSIATCAQDVAAALEVLGWRHATVVGHSWGASVALAAAASRPDLIGTAVLIDGGLWSPSGLGPRAEVREMLTPPTLGLPPDELWALVRHGDLGPSWSDEVQAALAATFVTDEQGLLRSRLGRERHLRVLDGLLDYDPVPDFDACEAAGTRIWAIVCEARAQVSAGPGSADPWRALKESSVASAARRANLLLHRWGGAVHDVPLQWPGLVAEFIDTAVGAQMGGDE